MIMTDKKITYWVTKARESKRESKHVDFKESIEFSSARDWCEIVKDIVAMANSGGGVIVVGVTDKGKPSSISTANVLSEDPAKITDKIARYTSTQFSDFQLQEIVRGRTSCVALIVSEAEIPMIFTKPGTYALESKPGHQRTVFGLGTMYFRHGAKSEPGVPDDLRAASDRHVNRIRKSWLSGIRKVVRAPMGHDVYMAATPPTELSRPIRVPGRIVGDARAPGFRPVHGDDLWPYRQKEIVQEINKRLRGTKINSYDIQCLRAVYNLESEKPNFLHRPFERIAPQYSNAFADWVVTEYEKNSKLFEKTRKKYRE